MPNRNSDNMSVGEDSFLDTTANLVGILIILVVVIGTKTKIDAEVLGQQLAAEYDPSSELEEPTRVARQLQSSLLKRENEILQYVQEAKFRKLERDKLLTKVTMAREKTAEKLSELDESQQAAIEQKQTIESLEQQLSDIKEQMGAAESMQRPEITLEHLPTPMARTVFNRELHLQLRDGELTIIPWDRCVQLLRESVPLAARRNRTRDVLEEQVGPIGGYMMRYRMLAVPGGFELDRFELELVSKGNTQPIAEAMAAGGRLRVELANRDPAETVVTVWVYPESFEAFRELKQQLFNEGFLCAARPLPEDVRIGASPRGTRSTAQ